MDLEFNSFGVSLKSPFLPVSLFELYEFKTRQDGQGQDYGLYIINYLVFREQLCRLW